MINFIKIQLFKLFCASTLHDVDFGRNVANVVNIIVSKNLIFSLYRLKDMIKILNDIKF